MIDLSAFDLRYVNFDSATGLIRQRTASPNDVDGLEVAEVVGDLPPDDQWLNYKVDLASVDAGTCALMEMPEGERPSFVPPLDQLKAMLARDVDDAAEREREKYITPGAGQALVYEAKRTEAAHWRAAGSPAGPDSAAYPWAADRANRLGRSIADVLGEWAAQADAWAAIGIAIERAREATKEAINTAASADAAHAGSQAIWPNPSA